MENLEPLNTWINNTRWHRYLATLIESNCFENLFIIIFITSLLSLYLVITHTKKTSISRNSSNSTRICAAYGIILARFDGAEFSTNIERVPREKSGLLCMLFCFISLFVTI